MRIEKSGRTTMAPRKRCEQMILLAFFIKHFLFIESPSSAGELTKTVRHLPQGYFCWARKVNPFPASPETSHSSLGCRFSQPTSLFPNERALPPLGGSSSQLLISISTRHVPRPTGARASHFAFIAANQFDYCCLMIVTSVELIAPLAFTSERKFVPSTVNPIRPLV